MKGIEAEGNPSDNAEEVGRYDLSGRPCTPSDKGVQIVVYSDFSAKTVVVE